MTKQYVPETLRETIKSAGIRKYTYENMYYKPIEKIGLYQIEHIYNVFADKKVFPVFQRRCKEGEFYKKDLVVGKPITLEEAKWNNTISWQSHGAR